MTIVCKDCAREKKPMYRTEVNTKVQAFDRDLGLKGVLESTLCISWDPLCRDCLENRVAALSAFVKNAR